MPEVKTLSQINVLVAEHVMGWPHIDENETYRYHHKKGGVIVNGVAQRFQKFGNEWVGIPEEWYPATGIEHAWHVVEKMIPDQTVFLPAGIERPSFMIEALNRTTYRAFLSTDKKGCTRGATTAPLAICLAALAAHGIDVSVKE